jgi:hypothetical protein
MASKGIMPKHDLRLIANAKEGDWVGTRFGDARVTHLMKTRAVFALKHFDDNNH